jgi:hypothetical protein
MEPMESLIIGLCIGVAIILLVRLWTYWKDDRIEREQRKRLERTLRDYHQRGGR